MRPLDPPPPEPVFRYRNPPRSGNEINGLGETAWRKPHKVFHRVPYGDPKKEPFEWRALDLHFNLVMGAGKPLQGFRAVRHVLLNRWNLRRANGHVAKTRREVADPAAMAEELRAWLTKRYPDAIVGFAGVDEDASYQGETLPGKYAICIGMPMDRETMVAAPQIRATVEVMRIYRRVAAAAVDLSEHIRSLGWPAKAYGDTKSTEILQIPLAIKAGLGELGKHGSMICKEYGSNFRLASVITEIPVALDAPVDIGVDDFCMNCRRCTAECPPDAIFDTKQTVRGVDKWYVDFDKCIPYFAENGGCAICLEVCPWSEPGRGDGMSAKMLARRARRRDPEPVPAE